MKTKTNRLLFILSLSLILLLPANNMNANNLIDNIATSIRTGNAKMLGGYFNNAVELTLPGKEGTFSKVQAELVIKDFFSKYPCSSFIVDQKGASSGGSQFMIGTYKSNSKVFKTYILLKPLEGQLLIQQVQFEAD